MELVTDEIQSAMKLLGLKEQNIQLLPDKEGQLVFSDLLNTFVEGADRRWWWEAFKEESKSITFDDGLGFERIVELVPNKKETIWFIAEETQLPFYPVYETTPEVVQKIIGECYGFEYYIIPKDKSWLLCENHHNRVIGIGEPVETNMCNINV